MFGEVVNKRVIHEHSGDNEGDGVFWVGAGAGALWLGGAAGQGPGQGSHASVQEGNWTGKSISSLNNQLITHTLC